MQDVDLIEKLTRFIRSLYERIRDWEFRHPWITRPFWYFALLMVVLGVCCYIFNYLNLYHTDADSARYMLSAMVQAQAAIIAIVITLTLIAVQLTASAYSPRVIRIFKNNPDMWLLLGFYGVSILYGLIVLKMVVGGSGEAVSQDVFWSHGFVPISPETCVSSAYWLEAFTLVALFPYMLNIIGLLKVENIIKRLALEITKDKILNPKKDPIQPIMDIIHSAVMKCDLETVRVGLNIVTDRVIKITDLYGEEEISKCFCDHFERVGRLAASNTDEESTIEVIKNLYGFWELTVEKGLDDAIKRVTWSLGRVGITAAEKGLRNATSRAARFLGRVGTITAEKGLEDATLRATQSLERVGNIAAEEGLGYATSRAVRSLKRIGKTAAEKGLKDATWQVAVSFGDVGMAAAKNGLDEVTKQAAKYLAELIISGKEIDRGAIRELARNDRDREFFDSFMNLYEQELKKLRTQQP